jgi:hypothetical protein
MKSYAKHLAVMVLAASIGLTGTAANATTTPLSFSGDTATFGNTFSIGTSSFNDLFTFITGPVSSAGAAAISSVYFNPHTLSVAFPVSFTTFSLINQSNNQTVTGTIGPSYFAYLGAGGLTANTHYALNVIGTVSSLTGGSYNGSITVTPVPEPQTWAMMLGGLGLIGFMSFRRRKYS